LKNKKTGGRRPSTARQKRAGKENLVAFNRSRGDRPNLKHGVNSLLRTGEIPSQIPDAVAITARVDGIVKEMVNDLGGDSEVTSQMRAILTSQKTALLVIALAEGHLRGQGLITKRGRPNALLSVLVSFGNLIRHNAIALGLDRKPRKVGPTTLVEYLASRPDTPNEGTSETPPEPSERKRQPDET
jgi:hypothetical protein